MKVQHTKTGRVAEVLSQDTKQVRIRFEDGTEQGMIPLTFKRWWKKLDEEPDEQTKKAIEVVKEMPAEKVVETVEKVIKKEKAKEALEDLKASKLSEEETKEWVETHCGDGTPLAEVGKEILEQAKAKAEQTSKEKAEKKVKPKTKKSKEPVDSSKADAVRDWILKYVKKQGGEVFAPANGMKMRTFKVGGKMYGRMDFSSKKVILSFKDEAIEETHITADGTRNHMFNRLFYITELTPKIEKDMGTLLDSAIKYRKTKKDNKKSKKEDK